MVFILLKKFDKKKMDLILYNPKNICYRHRYANVRMGDFPKSIVITQPIDNRHGFFGQRTYCKFLIPMK